MRCADCCWCYCKCRSCCATWDRCCGKLYYCWHNCRVVNSVASGWGQIASHHCCKRLCWSGASCNKDGCMTSACKQGVRWDWRKRHSPKWSVWKLKLRVGVLVAACVLGGNGAGEGVNAARTSSWLRVIFDVVIMLRRWWGQSQCQQVDQGQTIPTTRKMVQ